jgi:hypothetical protein
MTEPPGHPTARWTLDEAAKHLRPSVTRDQLARIFAQLPGLNPVGRRPTPGGGRPTDLWDMDEVIEWHHLNRRWLTHPEPDLCHNGCNLGTWA